MLTPVCQQPPADIIDFSEAEAVPVPVVQLHRAPLTFADMRLCLMRDFRDGTLGSDLTQAARIAIDRTDLLSLWPQTMTGWLAPFGQFLIDLAPLLDDPQTVRGRARVGEALHHA